VLGDPTWLKNPTVHMEVGSKVPYIIGVSRCHVGGRLEWEKAPASEAVPAVHGPNSNLLQADSRLGIFGAAVVFPAYTLVQSDLHEPP